jgi:hypothetical protein
VRKENRLGEGDNRFNAKGLTVETVKRNAEIDSGERKKKSIK